MTFLAALRHAPIDAPLVPDDRGWRDGGIRACRRRPFIGVLETKDVYFLPTSAAVLSTFVTHPWCLVH